MANLMEGLGRLFKVATDEQIASSHPYYPTSLNLKGYAEPQIPFQYILAVFFASAGIVFTAAWLLSARSRHLATKDNLVLGWFTVTGIVHLIIEGAFVLTPGFYQDTSGHILPEIWKEYAKADSRYATRDSFVVSMEAVTAFVEGPACFLIVYGMLTRKPWVYTAQLLVSLGQLYGDALYFGTCALEGWVHSRPEPLYFWFYFVFINGIWVVIPLLVLLYAARRINTAVARADGAFSTSKKVA